MAIYRIELSRTVGFQLLGGAMLLGGVLFAGGTMVGYSLASAGTGAAGEGEAPVIPDSAAEDPVTALAAPPVVSPEVVTAPEVVPTPEDRVAWAPADPTPGPDRRPPPDPVEEVAWLPPPPAGAPAAAPLPRESRGQGYAVQVGAFRVKGNADALASTLRQRGYDPLVVRARTRSGQWLEHVHLSVHAGERVALEAAESFSARERLPAVVVPVLEPGTEE